MVQYNGITLFRDDDGTPSRIDIDLHQGNRIKIPIVFSDT